MKKVLSILALLLLVSRTEAKVDLVTVPNRDTVQLTIYNSADLTLVRENRGLTLREGLNKLQFSWANTLIDPTSLSMSPKAHADQIEVLDVVYPPRVKNLGLWNIQSGLSGKVPMEITYLTSSLSWRAFYMGTLTPDEKTMRLQGYVRVKNQSGEDYAQAQVRLIVGEVNQIDPIATLAKRDHPYGRPSTGARTWTVVDTSGNTTATTHFLTIMDGREKSESLERLGRKKEVKKEGLSEYFLYTIEGRETIPHGWSKRLPSFEAGEVPVVNLYKYEEERYGAQVVRFLSFKNDEAHTLGETPIPGGLLKVYRTVDDQGHLSYEGQSDFKYIPVEEDVELNLGGVGNVTVRPTLMDYKTDRYLFHNGGNVGGWDEIRRFKVEVKNTRNMAVKVEVRRNFNTAYWTLTQEGDFGAFEKVDVDTVKFTLKLPPRSKQEFSYVLTTRHGLRENQ